MPGSEKEAPLTQTAQSGPQNALFPTRKQLRKAAEMAKKEGKQDAAPTASPPAADGETKDWPSEVPTDFVTFPARQQTQPSPSQLRTFYELKHAYSDLPFSAFSAVCIARGIPLPSSVP